MQLLELTAPTRLVMAHLLCMVPLVPQGQFIIHYSEAWQIGGLACGLLCRLANLTLRLSGKSLTLYKLWGLLIQACTAELHHVCHFMRYEAHNAANPV